MEARIEVYNGTSNAIITRNVLDITPIVERIGFGFEVIEVKISTSEITVSNLDVGFRIDVFLTDEKLNNHDNPYPEQWVYDKKVFGGIIYKIEHTHDGITTLGCESFSHGLKIRNPWNKLGATTEAKSVIYAYNNANILRLTPAGGLTYTSILMNGNSEGLNQTLLDALNEYAFSTGGYWRIDPDGNLYADTYATTGATLIDNQYLIEAKRTINLDGVYNRESRFLRALKDGDTSGNAETPVTTTGDMILGSFTASDDYWIAGVTFLVETPSSESFDLFLSTSTSSSVAIFSTTNRNLTNSKDHELAQIPVKKAISGITLTSGLPVSVNVNAHGFATGDTVFFENVGGTVGLNGQRYTITVVDANNFTLDGTNGDDYTAWTSGGDCWRDYLYYRTLMFDEMIRVTSGTTYYWIANYYSITGNAPNGKFGNVFNFGSRVKEYYNPLSVADISNANTTPSDNVEFTMQINEITLGYNIGDLVSLTSLGLPSFEVPTHIVKRRIDLRQQTITFYCGSVDQNIAEKIKNI